jgi:DNA-binding MarR family transcriptional regulator
MDDDVPPLFRLFNEIGILGQLSGALLQARLPQGVLPSHFAVLNHLVRVRDGATPLQLAQAFQVPKTTMTHTLSGLTRRGWVALRPNPGDARSRQVWLTDAGRAFRDETIAALAPDIARIEAALPGLAESVLPALTRLRRHLDAARDPHRPPPRPPAERG